MSGSNWFSPKDGCHCNHMMGDNLGLYMKRLLNRLTAQQTTKTLLFVYEYASSALIKRLDTQMTGLPSCSRIASIPTGEARLVEWAISQFNYIRHEIKGMIGVHIISNYQANGEFVQSWIKDPSLWIDRVAKINDGVGKLSQRWAAFSPPKEALRKCPGFGGLKTTLSWENLTTLRTFV